MPKVDDFYSVKETSKPPANRVYHNNSVCRRGRDILQSERKPGAHGYRMCDHCKSLNRSPFSWLNLSFEQRPLP